MLDNVVDLALPNLTLLYTASSGSTASAITINPNHLIMASSISNESINNNIKNKSPASPITPGTASTAATTPSPKKKRGKKKSGRHFHKAAVTVTVAAAGTGADGFVADLDVDVDDSIGRSRFSSAVYSCCGQPFHIHIVFSTEQQWPQSPERMNGTELAVVYTSGLQDCGFQYFVGGFAELVVFDVPICKVEQVCRLFTFVAHQMETHRLIKGGEIIDSDNLVMETKWISCPQIRARLFYRFPFLAGMSDVQEGPQNQLYSPSLPNCKWLAIQPQFPCPMDRKNHRVQPQRLWGARPPAPRGETKIRDRIVEILMVKVVLAGPGATLIWHVDGNPLNHCYANTQEVTPYEVFTNPSWNVNLSYILEGDDALISYTRAFMNHFATIFKPRNEKAFTKHEESSIRFKYHHEYSPYRTSESSQHNQGFLNLDSSEFIPRAKLSLPDAPPFGLGMDEPK